MVRAGRVNLRGRGRHEARAFCSLDEGKRNKEGERGVGATFKRGIVKCRKKID